VAPSDVQNFERVIEVVREVGAREKEARDVEAKDKLLTSRLASNEVRLLWSFKCNEHTSHGSERVVLKYST
jgi:hypothetical protein